MWKRGDRAPEHGVVIAHRAAASLAHGDPIAGLQALAKTATRMIEFDVRATADGVLVVHHDAEHRGMVLAKHRYADFERSGRPLVSLVDLLFAAKNEFALDIELKEPGYERLVVGTVLERVSPAKVAFTSFDDRVVAAIAGQQPEVGVGLILGRRAGPKTPWLALHDAFPFERLRRCGGDFLVPNNALLATGLARRALRRGVDLVVWGVDDPDTIERLRQGPGILGVITDSPQALLARPSTGGVREAQTAKVSR
jgi:glycerophosphoryl diester phosphodiesterase